MMSFTVSYSPAALRALKRIPRKSQMRIFRAVQSLMEFPFRGKKLQGELDGMYSLRVWPYRIIYTVHKRELVVIVLNIGHRQGVYHARN